MSAPSFWSWALAMGAVCGASAIALRGDAFDEPQADRLGNVTWQLTCPIDSDDRTADPYALAIAPDGAVRRVERRPEYRDDCRNFRFVVMGEDGAPVRISGLGPDQSVIVATWEDGLPAPGRVCEVIDRTVRLERPRVTVGRCYSPAGRSSQPSAQEGEAWPTMTRSRP